MSILSSSYDFLYYINIFLDILCAIIIFILVKICALLFLYDFALILIFDILHSLLIYCIYNINCYFGYNSSYVNLVYSIQSRQSGCLTIFI